MKLLDLLNVFLNSDKPKSDSIYFANLSGKLELESIKYELLKCDEFSSLDDLIIVNGNLYNEKDNLITPLSFQVDEKTSFKGILYLKNIYLNIIQDESKKYESNMYVSMPKNLDVENPKKQLTIEFDGSKDKEELLKYFYECVQKVVENQEAFDEMNLKPSTKYQFIVRGVLTKEKNLIEKDLISIKFMDKFKVKTKEVSWTVKEHLYSKYGPTLAGLTEEELEKIINENQ